MAGTVPKVREFDKLDDEDIDVSSLFRTDPAEGELWKAMFESLMRVSLAGIGGAISGTAIDRRGPPAMSMSVSAAKRQQHMRGARDLSIPRAWTVSCIGFVAIMEVVQFMSPMSYVQQYFIKDDNQYVRAFGDYTIGGSIAGSLFRGMQAQSRAVVNARIVTPRMIAGAGPGFVLGLVAGSLRALGLYVEHLQRPPETGAEKSS